MSYGIRRIGVGLLACGLLVGCGGGNGGSSEQPLVEQYEEALAEPNAESRVNLLVIVSKKQVDAGDKEGAELSLQKAAEACSEASSPAASASTYRTVATAQAKMGATSDAEKSLREVAKVLKEIKLPSERIGETRQMAYIYGKYLKKLDRSNSYLTMASEEASGLPSESDVEIASKAELLGDLARTYFALEQPEKGNAQIKAALELVDDIKSSGHAVKTWAILAGFLHKYDQQEQAAELFDKATATAKKIEDHESKAYALVAVASDLGKAGQAERARELLDEAKTASAEITDEAVKSEIHRKINDGREDL